MRKTYRWIYLVAVIVALSMVAACSGGGGNKMAHSPNLTVADPVLPDDDKQVAFGLVSAGTVTDATLTVSNNGSADLVLGSIDGFTAPFSTASDYCSGRTLATGGTCTFTITFSPVSIGTFAGTFDIPSNDRDTPVTTVSASGSAKIGLTAIAGYRQIMLSWTPVEGADAFNLYLSEDNAVWTKKTISGLVTSYTDTNLADGGTYYYKVSATVSSEEKYESDILSVSPKPAWISYDFEGIDPLQGWTKSYIGGIWEWGVVELASSPSGSYVISDSPISFDYGSNADTRLDSPLIDLTTTEAPTLNFWRSLQTEPGYDWCRTEISTDGGSTFKLLDQRSGYHPSFEEVTIDLSPYKTSSQVVIRFRLTANNNTITDKGCYIDDVVITQ